MIFFLFFFENIFNGYPLGVHAHQESQENTYCHTSSVPRVVFCEKNFFIHKKGYSLLISPAQSYLDIATDISCPFHVAHGPQQAPHHAILYSSLTLG